MKTLFGFFLLLAVTVSAQSPSPKMIVVQAANAAPAPAAPAVVAQDASGLRAALQTLEQIKAANTETIKKQEALLQQLDELQKAADQIKIFAHRSGG